MNRKNGTIEFYRFVFCILVVLCHTVDLAESDFVLFKAGSIGVEFFFVVSGYLMAKTIYGKAAVNKEILNGETIADETIQFIKRKIKSLCPNYYVAWIVAFVFYLFSHKIYKFRKIVKVFLSGFWELVFLNNTGLQVTGIAGATWYISAMLLCMVIIYPIMRKHTEVFTRIAAPVFSAIILGFLIHQYKTLRDVSVWIGPTYKSNLRAFAEICLGISIYPYSQRLKCISLTRHKRVCLSIVEQLGYFGLIYCAWQQKASKLDAVYLFFAAISIMISFSGQSIFQKLFDNKVCYWLGEFSLSLYLSHRFYSRFLNLIFTDKTYWELVPIYLALSFGTGIFVMYLSKFIKNKWRKKVSLINT